MRCPYCGNSESKVVDSRDVGDSTRRRRECLKCKKRFTTYERVDAVELSVVKKDGSIEQFDRNKIIIGLLKACQKRPIKREKIEQMADDIESELRAEKNTDIKSEIVGEKVMEKLKDVDKVAYIRFASVYRDFTDIRSFEKELGKLKKK